MDLYVTVQGDCWDSLAFELYGDEKYMQLLIEANWPLLDYLVFPSGIEIFVPDMPDEEDEDAPFWRLERTRTLHSGGLRTMKETMKMTSIPR